MGDSNGGGTIAMGNGGGYALTFGGYKNSRNPVPNYSTKQT